MISVPSEPLPRPVAKWPTGMEVWHKPHWGPHSSKLPPQPDHLPSFALSCPCLLPCNHAGYLLSPDCLLSPQPPAAPTVMPEFVVP